MSGKPERMGYEDPHPMVRRLRRIFDDPQPPAKVTQQQFDGAQEDLEALARKSWAGIGQNDYWAYLLDLCYQPLQQDLFDYVFPALLLRWWEGQRSRMGGPESECDFYRAVDHGDVFRRMMNAGRRDEVFAWMVDAYIDGVDSWGDDFALPQGSDLAHRMHCPLGTFHALGQSIPILDAIWRRLEDVTTAGRAQWWLVLATGLAFDPNTCPALPVWTGKHGGGGVYVLQSYASIFDHGYLPSNLDVLRTRLDAELVRGRLAVSADRLSGAIEREWAALVAARIEEDPERFELRVESFLDHLGQPQLGGVRAKL